LSTLALVRIRRHRYATVRSWLSTEPPTAPCGGLASDRGAVAASTGQYHLCPLVHSVVLAPPAGVWERLDAAQRNMWFIDEVEARWQRLLAKHPSTERLELKWCAPTDFSTLLGEYARFVGGTDLTALDECKQPQAELIDALPADGAYNDTYLAGRDEEYLRLMGLTSTVSNGTSWTARAQTILATQQSVLCP